MMELSGKTTQELEQLQRDAADLVNQRRAAAEANRSALVDPAVVQGQVQDLLAQIDELNALIATPNADVRANPAPHIMTLARANRRSINNLVRLLRVISGLLDSADTGEERSTT